MANNSQNQEDKDMKTTFKFTSGFIVIGIIIGENIYNTSQKQKRRHNNSCPGIFNRKDLNKIKVIPTL